jgi:hypothetical protein
MTHFEIVPGVGEAEVVKIEHFLNLEEVDNLFLLPFVFLVEALQFKFDFLRKA